MISGSSEVKSLLHNQIGSPQSKICFFREKTKSNLRKLLMKSHPSIKYESKHDNIPTHGNYQNVQNFSNIPEKPKDEDSCSRTEANENISNKNITPT